MKKKLALFVSALALALLALPGLAFADGPALEDSDPADGAVVVKGDEVLTFTLHFSNNVAESTVAEDNIAKIHLEFLGEGSHEVAYGVFVVDPNEDRDKRQYIYISVDKITPGQWQIVVDPGITSKKGEVSDQGYFVTFTVEGDAPAPAGGGFPSWAWIAIAAVVVIAVVAVVLLKRKPKTE